MVKVGNEWREQAVKAMNETGLLRVCVAINVGNRGGLWNECAAGLVYWMNEPLLRAEQFDCCCVRVSWVEQLPNAGLINRLNSLFFLLHWKGGGERGFSGGKAWRGLGVRATLHNVVIEHFCCLYNYTLCKCSLALFLLLAVMRWLCSLQRGVGAV